MKEGCRGLVSGADKETLHSDTWYLPPFVFSLFLYHHV